MFQRFATALLLRALTRDLAAIAETLRAQTALLARLVDRLAPADPVTRRPEVLADTGVSHLDAEEAAAAIAYINRTQADTGHIPDDDEILIHLADEKTATLHERLATREDELSRLKAAREW
jgi:hypothetical protein